MDQGRTVKKILQSKPAGRRKRGRPRLRWLEDAGKGLQEMKVNGGRRQSIGKNRHL